jgi:hypothetical protein
MKVSVEFDTKDKMISAKIDGQEIANLYSIIFYTYDGKANFELCTNEMNEAEKMYSVTRIYAEEKDELVIKEPELHKLIAKEIFGV